MYDGRATRIGIGWQRGAMQQHCTLMDRGNVCGELNENGGSEGGATARYGKPQIHSGDVVGVAADLDAREVSYTLNGVPVRTSSARLRRMASRLCTATERAAQRNTPSIAGNGSGSLVSPSRRRR